MSSRIDVPVLGSFLLGSAVPGCTLLGCVLFGGTLLGCSGPAGPADAAFGVATTPDGSPSQAGALATGAEPAPTNPASGLPVDGTAGPAAPVASPGQPAIVPEMPVQTPGSPVAPPGTPAVSDTVAISPPGSVVSVGGSPGVDPAPGPNPTPEPTAPVVVATGGTGPGPSATGGNPTVAGSGAGGEPLGVAGANAGAGNGGTPVLPMEGEVLFSEDFEAQTVGQAPSGWDNFIAWQKNNPMPTADTFVQVDDVDGSRVVHFKGGQNPAQITRPLPGGSNVIYVSARVKMSRQLGQNPGANHETLIGIRGESGSANNEIRFGEIKGVIGTNEVPSDNISPLMDQWGMGPAVLANTWACFEVAFLGDQAQHELHAWVDGELVHSVTAPDQWQNGPMPATWMDGKFVEVMLGWHSFSSQNIDVWMDDIIVATGRRGCP